MEILVVRVGYVWGLAGCASDLAYAAPEAFGLIGGRGFQAPDGVYPVIGASASTPRHRDDRATLVGCPIEETGAVADRNASGGVQARQVGGDTLLYVLD